jgi:hypothetical protein
LKYILSTSLLKITLFTFVQKYLLIGIGVLGDEGEEREGISESIE